MISSHCSNVTDLSAQNVVKLLPTLKVLQDITNNFSVLLVSHILVIHLDYFQTGFADMVNHHITHLYSKEMAQQCDTESPFIHSSN